MACHHPGRTGFSALRAESLAQNLNMLRRLAENWQRGENRFNAGRHRGRGSGISCCLGYHPLRRQL
jgi:hypothetical protein